MNLNTINILALVVGKANKGALNGKSECQESWDQDSFYRTGRGGGASHLVVAWKQKESGAPPEDVLSIKYLRMDIGFQGEIGLTIKTIQTLWVSLLLPNL
jgi:hypothetical protein